MNTLKANLLKSIATNSATNKISNCNCAVSPSGDIYVTGDFTGTLDIGGDVPKVTTISTEGSAFLARYSSTLTPTGLKYMSNTEPTKNSRGYTIAISPSGDVYVTGIFSGTLNIGDGVPSVTTKSSNSAYIARYSSTLTPTHLKYMSNTKKTDSSVGTSVAISPSGDVYVTGYFSGTLNIGGVVPTVTTISISSAFLARYSSTLTPSHLKYMSNNTKTHESIGTSVAISPGGDVYVTGYFTGTLEIGGVVPTVTTISTGGSTFMARYSSTLTPTGLKYMSNTEPDTNSQGYSLAISSSGDVYVTGYFNGTLDIGDDVPTVTAKSSLYSTFVAKYSSTLKPTILTYMTTRDSTDYSRGFLLAISSNDEIYVTGDFTGTLDIGGSVKSITTNSSDGSCYLANYSSTLTPTILKYMSGTNKNDYSMGLSVVISPSGDVYVTGDFTGTLNIGGSVPKVTSKITAGSNGFLAKYTTNHNEPICLVSGTPILTDQGIVAIEKIDTAKHTIGNQRIVAVTKAITPEKNLICFEPHSVAINCPTKRTIMTPGHEVLYKGKLVQAKHFVGKLNGVHTVPYDGKVVYNVLLQQHGVMSVNNMILETLHPENKVAKDILNAF
jgi:hypothetical protein